MDPRTSLGLKRLKEADAALLALGFKPKGHSPIPALCLLAYAGIGPATPWSDAGSPLLTVTQAMEFARREYAYEYAANTRETFRHGAIRPFVALRLLVANPDAPNRPRQSPNNRYQLQPDALALLQLLP
ncbi:MAG: hypothetical protein KIT44_06535 [Opitutaceae bacterium]|nr:hypothetical protein [Opitutaceae bacterium]